MPSSSGVTTERRIIEVVAQTTEAAAGLRTFVDTLSEFDSLIGGLATSIQTATNRITSAIAPVNNLASAWDNATASGQAFLRTAEQVSKVNVAPTATPSPAPLSNWGRNNAVDDPGYGNFYNQLESAQQQFVQNAADQMRVQHNLGALFSEPTNRYDRQAFGGPFGGPLGAGEDIGVNWAARGKPLPDWNDPFGQYGVDEEKRMRDAMLRARTTRIFTGFEGNEPQYLNVNSLQYMTEQRRRQSTALPISEEGGVYSPFPQQGQDLQGMYDQMFGSSDPYLKQRLSAQYADQLRQLQERRLQEQEAQYAQFFANPDAQGMFRPPATPPESPVPFGPMAPEYGEFYQRSIGNRRMFSRMGSQYDTLQQGAPDIAAEMEKAAAATTSYNQVFREYSQGLLTATEATAEFDRITKESTESMGKHSGGMHSMWQSSFLLFGIAMAWRTLGQEVQKVTGEPLPQWFNVMGSSLNEGSSLGMTGAMLGGQLEGMLGPMAGIGGLAVGAGIGIIGGLVAGLAELPPDIQALNNELDNLGKKDVVLTEFAKAMGLSTDKAGDLLKLAAAYSELGASVQRLGKLREEHSTLDNWMMAISQGIATNPNINQNEIIGRAGGLYRDRTSDTAFAQANFEAEQRIAQYRDQFSGFLGATANKNAGDNLAQGSKLLQVPRDTVDSYIKLAAVDADFAAQLDTTSKKVVDYNLALQQSGYSTKISTALDTEKTKALGDLAAAYARATSMAYEEDRATRATRDHSTWGGALDKTNLGYSVTSTSFADMDKAIAAGMPYLDQLRDRSIAAGASVTDINRNWTAVGFYIDAATGQVRAFTGAQLEAYKIGQQLVSQAEKMKQAWSHPSVSSMPELNAGNAGQLQSYIKQYEALLTAQGVQQDPQRFLMFGQNGFMAQFVTSSDAMTLAMALLREQIDMQTAATKDNTKKSDQLRGHFNIPTEFGYQPPTPGEVGSLYKKNGWDMSGLMGPVNYPWMFPDKTTPDTALGKWLAQPHMNEVPGSLNNYPTSLSLTAQQANTAAIVANTAALLGVTGALGPSSPLGVAPAIGATAQNRPGHEPFGPPEAVTNPTTGGGGGRMVQMIPVGADQVTNGAWQDPLRGMGGGISQKYGNVSDWYTQHGLAGHEGIDFSAPPGTPIYPVTPGKVVKNWQGSDYGNAVEIQDAKGNIELYAHMLTQSLLKIGQDVAAGTLIGQVGSTGHSSGPHLHLGFEPADPRQATPGMHGWGDPTPMFGGQGGGQVPGVTALQASSTQTATNTSHLSASLPASMSLMVGSIAISNTILNQMLSQLMIVRDLLSRPQIAPIVNVQVGAGGGVGVGGGVGAAYTTGQSGLGDSRYMGNGGHIR